MTPALPPSSSTTFFLPARSFIRHPTEGDPVNVSSLNRSSLTIRSPSSRLIGRMLTAPSGMPGGVEDLRDREHHERVLGRRLEHDRVARGDRRRDLVRGEVEREVERADAGDRADREAAGDPRRGPWTTAMRSSGMTSPYWRSASSAPSRKVRLARSTSVSASRIGLPASAAISAPELLAPGLDAGAHLAQDPAALVGGHDPGDLERLDRGLDGLLVLRLGREVRGPGELARPGRVLDLEQRRASRPMRRRGRSDAA